ncbi:hypothetical protein LSAT2_016389, partial [Lamellibrachia satsuma]
QQAYTFWEVEPHQSYVACVRARSGNKSDPYAWVRKDVLTSEAKQPPQIRESPLPYILFQSGDTIPLSCVVAGLPPPRSV